MAIWKGTKNEYQAIHKWIRNHYGKANKCEECHTKNAWRYDWANISGKYLRERTDYRQLCRNCHKKTHRKKFCIRGHKFTKENTYLHIRKDRDRIDRSCLTCMKAHTIKWRNENRERFNKNAREYLRKYLKRRKALLTLDN